VGAVMMERSAKAIIPRCVRRNTIWFSGRKDRLRSVRSNSIRSTSSEKQSSDSP
jgi:hypothetical protein